MVMTNQTMHGLDWKQIDPGDIEAYIMGRSVIGGDLVDAISEYSRILGRRVHTADAIEIYFSGRAGGPRLALRLDASLIFPGDWPVDYPIRAYVAEFTDDLVSSEELERLVEAGED